MLVDGKKIAGDIQAELQVLVRERGAKTLAAVLVGENPVSARFVKRKQKIGGDIGVAVAVYELPESVSQNEVETLIERDNCGMKSVMISMKMFAKSTRN